MPSPCPRTEDRVAPTMTRDAPWAFLLLLPHLTACPLSLPQATKQFLEEINKWTGQYNVSPLSWNVAVKFLMARKFDVLRAIELFHSYRVSEQGWVPPQPRAFCSVRDLWSQGRPSPCFTSFSHSLMSFIQLENPFSAKTSHHGDLTDPSPLPSAESSVHARRVPSRLVCDAHRASPTV